MRLTWDLPAEAQHVRLCRQLVCLTLQHMRVEERDIEDIELALGELCTNVIRHARMTPGSKYQVELELMEDRALITVSDEGVGFIPNITVEPTPTESGGLGLWLVEQLTDKLEFQSLAGQGTKICAERQLHIQPSTPETV
ncbi:MAG: ATP-binding protein [Armatimonadetes bacterium]|nr:ATP-binding protein [Armatimonadota bacterium]